MRKHGFTLTELMIVIVITGLLTAVAVPKLASVIAKAKASELAPAASTYSKLQAAYLYENKAFGTWKKIGYRAPGKKGLTDSFKYSGGEVSGTVTRSNLSKILAGNGKISWQAENIIALGNCQKGNLWKIRAVAQSDTDIEFRAYIEPSTTSNDCIALASDWGHFQNQISMNTTPAGHAQGSSNSVVAVTSSTSSSASTGSGEGHSTNSSNSSVVPSSSNTQVASKYKDSEENWEEEDDGSCGVMVTSAGDRCPPSWCKLNGNLSKNHNGWGNSGHKWNECYAARQDLIKEAEKQNLITCKNEKNCKLTDKNTTVVINGKVITGGGYNDNEFADENSTPIVFNGAGRENAEKALGGDVMCVDNANDSKCQHWRAASDCEYPSKNNKTCNGWKS